MIDISEVSNGDIQVFNSNVGKATNLLSVQLGSLDYAPTFGVDLRYFLSENFQFQNESFRAYLLQRLAENSIDVVSVIQTVDNLFSQYTFNLAKTAQGDGLVR